MHASCVQLKCDEVMKVKLMAFIAVKSLHRDMQQMLHEQNDAETDVCNDGKATVERWSPERKEKKSGGERKRETKASFIYRWKAIHVYYFFHVC